MLKLIATFECQFFYFSIATEYLEKALQFRSFRNGNDEIEGASLVFLTSNIDLYMMSGCDIGGDGQS